MGWFSPREPRLPVGDEAQWFAPPAHKPAPVAQARLPVVLPAPASNDDKDTFILGPTWDYATFPAGGLWVNVPENYYTEIMGTVIGLRISYDGLIYHTVQVGDILPPPPLKRLHLRGTTTTNRIGCGLTLGFLREDVALRRKKIPLVDSLQLGESIIYAGTYLTTDGASITLISAITAGKLFALRRMEWTVSTLGTAACTFWAYGEIAQTATNASRTTFAASAAVGTRTTFEYSPPLVLSEKNLLLVKNVLVNEPAVDFILEGHTIG